MCLIKITKRWDPPLSEAHGLKIFSIYPEGLQGYLYTSYYPDIPEKDPQMYPTGVYYDLDRWYSAQARMSNRFLYLVNREEEVNEFYREGFHAVTNEKEAQDFMRAATRHDPNSIAGLTIRRVRLRGVHTKGIDEEGVPTIIAEQMLIIRGGRIAATT